MKQNLLEAKYATSLVVALIVGFALFEVSCLQRTRHNSLHTSAGTEAPHAGARVNINTASAEELERLPGIGRLTAERIIEHRSQYGQFRRVEHVMMVRGISERKFRAMEAQITVQNVP